MIVVTNRLPVAAGREEEFEEKFRARARRVESAAGFVRLEILRPQARVKDESGQWRTTKASDAPLEYEVRSYWRSMSDFDEWTGGEAFRGAHEKVLDDNGRPTAERLPSGLLLGRPVIRFFEVLEE